MATPAAGITSTFTLRLTYLSSGLLFWAFLVTRVMKGKQLHNSFLLVMFNAALLIDKELSKKI
jgi:hypothetical protein